MTETTEKQIASNTVFAGKLVRVRVDTVELPDGRQAFREVVGHRPAVVVVPIDADGNVLLVSQYRYPIGEELLEAPAGVMEDGETPDECANRELQEETGHLGRSLVRLGQFWSVPGFCDELMHVYLARDLEPSVLEADPDENITTELVPFASVGELIRTGAIQDAKTIAALLMATHFESQGATDGDSR